VTESVPYKVLLVEDVEDNRGIIRQLARRMRLTLIEAADGAEGVRMARAEMPDLILMDLSLPVMDGWTATAQLKSDPTTRHILVVALTAHAMAGDEQRSREAGLDAYLAKPFGIEEFTQLVGGMLAGVSA
jgi:two-component system cell cycle response regulator DivK